LKSKSYTFALRVVKKEYVLGKQILRSGTAIWALIAESEFA